MKLSAIQVMWALEGFYALIIYLAIRERDWFLTWNYIGGAIICLSLIGKKGGFDYVLRLWGDYLVHLR